MVGFIKKVDLYRTLYSLGGGPTLMMSYHLLPTVKGDAVLRGHVLSKKRAVSDKKRLFKGADVPDFIRFAFI